MWFPLRHSRIEQRPSNWMKPANAAEPFLLLHMYIYIYMRELSLLSLSWLWWWWLLLDPHIIWTMTGGLISSTHTHMHACMYSDGAAANIYFYSVYIELCVTYVYVTCCCKHTKANEKWQNMWLLRILYILVYKCIHKEKLHVATEKLGIHDNNNDKIIMWRKGYMHG